MVRKDSFRALQGRYHDEPLQVFLSLQEARPRVPWEPL